MRRKAWEKGCVLWISLCLAAGMLTGCGRQGESVSKDIPVSGDRNQAGVEVSGSQAPEAQASGAQAAIVTVADLEEMFTDRDLSGDYDERESFKVALDDSGFTVTKEGVYVISGSSEGGMIIVDVEEDAKVQLVLDNVEISGCEGAAIYVRQADKVFLTLAEGSVNTLSGGTSHTKQDDNNVDGVIFAKSDLVINGSGSLSVTAATGHGIVSKDDLKVTGGTVTVTAPGHGLSGKDSVRITAGTGPSDSAAGTGASGAEDSGSAAGTGSRMPELHITSGKDGIHSENADRADKGFVCIAGGSISIVSDGDCISAGSYLQVDGGSFQLTAGQGSANRTVAVEEDGSEVSAKGGKAGGQLVVNGGSFEIDTQDDALHSDEDLCINGGEFRIATGDDGLHAEETAQVAGGNITISTCYEGIEGKDVVISGGSVRLYAADDGLNAAGGSGTSHSLLISGGILYVNADGDGIDSNGSITVTGGEVYVSGPESGANGALDYESDARITGGILVAVGDSGMAMNFGEASTQGSALVNTSRCEAGTEISLQEEDGTVLAAFTAESGFNSVVVSCPEMVEGGRYILHVGNGEYEITLDSLIYGTGFGGFGGGRGGFGGQRPGMQEDGGQRPGMQEDGGQRPGMPGNGEEQPQMPEGGKRWPETSESEGQWPELPEGGGQRPEMPEDGGQWPERSGKPEDRGQ